MSLLSLAQAAAHRQGSSDPDIVRAIMSQWRCEGPYPPRRNNPGNVTASWARALGYRVSVQFPNPQPGNPIATFPTALAGAYCYSDGLVKFPRYHGVRAAVAAGDGREYLIAVCAAGYGTSLKCCVGVYGTITPEQPSTPPGVVITAPTPAEKNVMIPQGGLTITSSHVMNLSKGQPLYRYPGGPKVTLLSRAAAVPYIGSAGSGWRAVQVDTAAPYPDKVMRPTIVYVPAAAGTVEAA